MGMKLKNIASHALDGVRIALGCVALFQMSLGAALVNAPEPEQLGSGQTRSPIKHVIVIIGENRSFDHVFATYEPRRGEKVWNLLSEGIVTSDGSPGRNFYKAEQHAA